MSVRATLRDRLPSPLLLLVRRGYRAVRHSTLRLLAASRLQQRGFGRVPDLVHPRLFSDKVQWRMLYDRRPLLQVCSDRMKTRDYVAAKGGADYLVPLLGVFDRPDQVPWDELPPPYVVKATHGCGWNIIVRDPGEVKPELFERTLEGWLKTNYYHVNWEWSYKHVPRRIIVERFIGQEGKLPQDFKVHCFDGEPRAIAVCYDRSRPAERWVWRDPEWNVLDVFHRVYTAGPPTPPPAGLVDMIWLARAVSRDFDYIRVDMYCVDDHVYLGELTPTQSAGKRVFSDAPETWLGSLWHLPSRATLRKARRSN